MTADNDDDEIARAICSIVDVVGLAGSTREMDEGVAATKQRLHSN